jgi:hypothetical protein
MALPENIAEHFRGQAKGSEDLGSPFTARLCRLLADRLEPDGAFAKRIAGWPGDARADAMSLRAVGGLHAVARSGRCPALSAVYPPNKVDADAIWSGVSAAIAQEDAFLSAYLDGPPQTNEVARSNVVLGGCLYIAAETSLPLELFEIGSSAGLNLGFDRYRYDFGVGRWGADDAAVRIATRWEGAGPDLATPLTVLDRAGCDLRPIDPAAPADRERLLSYIWPDQSERLARAEAALSLAAKSETRVERADAGDWLAARLAAPASPHRTRVVFHTIVWPYLPDDTKARLTSAIGDAGARATADAPLAWLRMEPDDVDGSAAIHVTIWPSGKSRMLGRTDFHGRWTSWTNGAA